MTSPSKRTHGGAVVVLALLVVLVVPPALAGGPVTHDESQANTAAQAVRDGVDFDAGCLLSTQPPPGQPLNWLASPAPPVAPTQRQGCDTHPGVTMYDRSTESLDIATGAFSSSGSRYSATWDVDGGLPAFGAISPMPLFAPAAGASPDLPHNLFNGAGYYTMFQNKDKQHNGDNLGSGAMGLVTPRVRDQHGHWGDGYHFFASVSYDWDAISGRWVWRAALGEYYPFPGAFFFTELGHNDGGGWTSNDPAYPYGPPGVGRWTVTVNHALNTITLEFEGRHTATCGLCVGGIFVTDYGSNSPGPYSGSAGSGTANPVQVRSLDSSCGGTYSSDCIRNVKFLTTANVWVALPGDGLPLNQFCGPTMGVVCADITSIGGFAFFVDTTSGNSTAGLGNTNPTGSAFSHGLVGWPDTLGNGPNCPTPTLGGTLPNNPNWVNNQNRPCQNDDDNFSRGSLFVEWWDTTLGFHF